MDKLADALGIEPHRLPRAECARRRATCCPTGQIVTGSMPVADVIRRCARDPRPGSRGDAARPDPPPGRRREHDARRGRPQGRRLRARLQEHLLLGGLRRLLRGPRAPLRRRRRRAGRRGLLGRGRGRPGRRQRHGPGRADGARHRERRRRAALDGSRRVGGLVVGVAPDLDDGRRRPARLPGGAGASSRRRGGSLEPGEEIDVERVYRHARTYPLDPETGQIVGGDRAHVAFACAAMRVVAEVDVELGLTRVVWIGTAQDVGTRDQPAGRLRPDRGRHRAGPGPRAHGGDPDEGRPDHERELHRLPDPDGARHAARSYPS